MHHRPNVQSSAIAGQLARIAIRNLLPTTTPAVVFRTADGGPAPARRPPPAVHDEFLHIIHVSCGCSCLATRPIGVIYGHRRTLEIRNSRKSRDGLKGGGRRGKSSWLAVRRAGKGMAIDVMMDDANRLAVMPRLLRPTSTRLWLFARLVLLRFKTSRDTVCKPSFWFRSVCQICLQTQTKQPPSLSSSYLFL